MPAQTLNEITSFVKPVTKHDKQRVTFSNYDGSALPISCGKTTKGLPARKPGNVQHLIAKRVAFEL
jgi:hypothetical protein